MVLSSNVSSGRSPWTGFEHGPPSTLDRRPWFYITADGKAVWCRQHELGRCKNRSLRHFQAGNADRALVMEEVRRTWDDGNRLSFNFGGTIDRRTPVVHHPRDIALFAYEAEQVRGGLPADAVTADGNIKVANSDPVTLTRVLKPAASGTSYIACWQLKRHSLGKVYSDQTSFTTTEWIADFLSGKRTKIRANDPGTTFPVNTGEDVFGAPAEGKSVHAELYARLLETLRAVEAEASIANRDSVTALRVPYPSWFTLDDVDRVQARINYGATGFRPEHLRGLDTVRMPPLPGSPPGASDRRVPPNGIAPGFEVYDTDAGDGLAAWRVRRDHDGWEVQLRGTYGDLTTWRTTTADDIAEELYTVYSRRIRARGNVHLYAKRLGVLPQHLLAPYARDATTEQQRNNRVGFILRLITEGNALDDRAISGAKGTPPDRRGWLSRRRHKEHS